MSIVALILQSSAATADPGAGVPLLHTPDPLIAHCVAAEPLVQHPVAIDWSATGDLWVAEYAGLDSTGELRGRVVLLQDSDDDGFFDQRAVFLAGLPLVTSVLNWPPGVLIAAAPDLLYAEDRNGDGQPEEVRRLWVGFGAESPTQRFNSLTVGLDGWVLAASGWGGGRVRPLEPVGYRPTTDPNAEVNLAESDFRFDPASGRLEPVAGLCWIGRMRDEFDRWLGIDPDLGLVQFPLPRRYTRRNPAVVYPDPVVPVHGPFRTPATADESQPDYLPPGSASIHQGPPLGSLCPGDLLVTSPEEGCVRRQPLLAGPLLFATASEDTPPLAQSNASEFTPVQARTGPDDALWIVDFQRIHTSSGTPVSPKGRLYRLAPAGQPADAWPRRRSSLLDDPLSSLAQPNGPLRALARHLVRNAPVRPDLRELRAIALPPSPPNTSRAPDQLPTVAPTPAAQVQALWLLHELGALTPADLQAALHNPSPDVRQQALRLSEYMPPEALSEALLPLADDPVLRVRFQLALSAGSLSDPAALACLARLAHRDAADPWMRSALLTSADGRALPWIQDLLNNPPADPSATSDLIEGLVATLFAHPEAADFDHVAAALAATLGDRTNLSAFAAAAALVDLAFQPLRGFSATRSQSWMPALTPLLDHARDRIQALPAVGFESSLLLRLLGLQPPHLESDLATLLAALARSDDATVQRSARQTLLRLASPDAAGWLLDHWWVLPPSLRGQLLGRLLATPESAHLLLAALEEGRLGPQELSAPQQNRLLEALSADDRSRADPLLAAARPEPRSDVIDAHLNALQTPGDPASGAVIFADLCSRCHRIGSTGHAVGPDLTLLSRRTPRELLDSILDPNALVDPAWRTYLAETRDEEAVTGILTRENPTSVELLAPGGIHKRWDWPALRELRVSQLSMMPEGLEQGLSPQALADLLAFLCTNAVGRPTQ